MDNSQFKITNPTWDFHLNQITSIVYAKLGLTYGLDNVQAELYKLLIYERGAFFRAHQDSQKANGMFGTLVISLPSKHEGGKVVFSHNGEKEEYDSAQYGPFQASFGAWYSDVYHEVQKVTAGYRVVLVYNLVQNATDTPQDPPDGESKRQVRDALERYEQELIKDTCENTESNPGYLIHKLQHLYCEHGLNLKSLKGNDAVTVQNLAVVCEAVGFDIYLGALEKEISEDQSMPGPEVRRSEKFAYVAKLDGSKTNHKPPYQHRNLIFEDEEEEGFYEGSEHDEYTGNEGALSTWRYKSSVALLVPPSRKLEFSMSQANKLADALGMLPDLRSKAVNNQENKETLYNLCQIVLRTPKPKTNHIRPDPADENQRKACINHVVLAALEHGWLHLADKAFVEQRHDKEHVLAYGSYISKNEVSHRNDSLWKTSSVPLSTKHSILSEIVMAMKEQPLIKEQQSYLQIWYQTALFDILASDTSFQEDDGIVLCAIIETCGLDIFDGVISRLKSASLLTLVSFVHNLTHVSGSSKRSALTRYRKVALEQIWPKFAYFEEIRKDQLCELIELTTNLDVIPVSDAIQAICNASPTLKKWVPEGKFWEKDPSEYRRDKLKLYVAEVLVPLICAVIGSDMMESLFTDNTQLTEALSLWIAATLCLYVHREVGKEPQPPANWSLEPLGCRKCNLCNRVAEFLKHPQKQSMQAKVTQKQKDHLNQYFWCHTIHISFQVEVTQDTGEEKFRWKCTKVHKQWKQDHAKWTKRQSQAERFLRSANEQCSGNLEAWLGDSFEAITSCQVENLLDLDTSIFDAPCENADSTSDAQSKARLPVKKTAHQKRRKFEIEEAEFEQMMMFDRLMGNDVHPDLSSF